MGPHTSAIDQHNERLAEALEFTPEDLSANKAGLVTARQRLLLEQIIRWRRGSGRCSVLAVLLSLAVVGAVGYFPLLAADATTLEEQLPIIYGSWLGVGGAVVIIFVLFMWLDRARLAEVRSGNVSVAEGRADLKMRVFKGRLHGVKAYYLSLGRVKFQLANESQYEAFQQGEPYRVFYVRNPPTHTILSAEWLGDA